MVGILSCQCGNEEQLFIIISVNQNSQHRIAQLSSLKASAGLQSSLKKNFIIHSGQNLVSLIKANVTCGVDAVDILISLPEIKG